MGAKAEYVRREGCQPANGHRCHATGCTVQVAPAYLMCPRHWRLVPLGLQRAIWRHFRPGQEKDKRPSREYVEALRAAVAAVAKLEGRDDQPI